MVITLTILFLYVILADKVFSKAECVVYLMTFVQVFYKKYIFVYMLFLRKKVYCKYAKMIYQLGKWVSQEDDKT